MTTRLALALVLALLALLPAATSVAAPIARTTSLISVPTGLPDPDTDDAGLRAVSTDGARVFFETSQTLVTGDDDGGLLDVYERSGGTTKLISAPTGVADPGTAAIELMGVSDDGAHVFFETSQKMTADDGDTNRADVYERSGGVTTLASAPTGVGDPNTSDATFAGNSADGSHVFFTTGENLTAADGDASFIDLYEHAAGATALVSAPTGVADPGNGGAGFSGSSADGSRVFFNSSQKLTPDDDDSGFEDLYERSGGTTTLVSKPTGVADPNDGSAGFQHVSADGTRVLFETTQKLTAGDGDSNRRDLYERFGGTTTLVSGSTGVADPDTEGVFFRGASADAARVFFETTQKLTTDDGDSDLQDVYEHSAGTTKLVSGPTGVADPDSDQVEFEGTSSDGSRVFFETTQQLTPDDGDSDRQDVYERASGTTTLVSQPTGVADPDSENASFQAASADGGRVFVTTDQKLTADDGDAARGDVYERSEGVTTLISKPTGVADPDSDGVSDVTVSGDGSRVFYRTSQRLTSDDGDSDFEDVYMAADVTAPQTTITFGPAGATGDSTPTFGFSSDEAGSSFECKVDAGAFAPCASPITLGPLADGPHSFQVRATDNVGNVDPSAAVRGFTVGTSSGGAGGPGVTPGPAAVPGPASALIQSALAGDLRAAARLLKRLGIAKARRRSGSKLRGVDALAAGTVRITADATVTGKSGAARRVRVLSGRRTYSRAGKATLRLKPTRKGRALLRRARRLRLTLRATFTAKGGGKTSAKPRRVTIRRRR